MWRAIWSLVLYSICKWRYFFLLVTQRFKLTDTLRVWATLENPPALHCCCVHTPFAFTHNMDHHLCVFSHPLLDVFRASILSVVLTFIFGAAWNKTTKQREIWLTVCPKIANKVPLFFRRYQLVQHLQVAWWDETWFRFDFGCRPDCPIPGQLVALCPFQGRHSCCWQENEICFKVFVLCFGAIPEFVLRILAATCLDWISLCEVYWHVIFILQTCF